MGIEKNTEKEKALQNIKEKVVLLQNEKPIELEKTEEVNIPESIKKLENDIDKLKLLAVKSDIQRTHRLENMRGELLNAKNELNENVETREQKLNDCRADTEKLNKKKMKCLMSHWDVPWT